MTPHFEVNSCKKKKLDKLLYLACNSHFQTFHTLSGSLMYNKLNLICTTKQVFFFFSTGSLKSLHKKDVLLISKQYPLGKKLYCCNFVTL